VTVTIVLALASFSDVTQIEMILIAKASKEGNIALQYRWHFHQQTLPMPLRMSCSLHEERKNGKTLQYWRLVLLSLPATSILAEYFRVRQELKKGLHLGRATALLANIKPGWKWLEVTSILLKYYWNKKFDNLSVIQVSTLGCQNQLILCFYGRGGGGLSTVSLYFMSMTLNDNFDVVFILTKTKTVFST
jgi:hypothetical protein